VPRCPRHPGRHHHTASRQPERQPSLGDKRGPRDRVRGNSPAGCWSRRLDDPVTQQVPLFGPRRHLRNMVVLADAALLHEEEPNAWTPKSVLASLLDHQPVDGYRYAEAGPPGDADRLRRPRGVGAVGWVTLAQANAEAGGVQPFNYADKTTLHRSAIDTGAVHFAAEDVGSDSYRELDLDSHTSGTRGGHASGSGRSGDECRHFRHSAPVCLRVQRPQAVNGLLRRGRGGVGAHRVVPAITRRVRRPGWPRSDRAWS